MSDEAANLTLGWDADLCRIATFVHEIKPEDVPPAPELCPECAKRHQEHFERTWGKGARFEGGVIIAGAREP